MGIRNYEKAPNLAREVHWGNTDNAAYEKGPDLRYGDSLEGLNDAGASVPLLSVNSTSHPQLGPQTELDTATFNGIPITMDRVRIAHLPGTLPASAGNYGAFASMELAGVVLGVSAFHEAAGSDGSAVSLDIEKLTGTQAPGAGVSVLGATKIDLKAAANTRQAPALTATGANKTLAIGDRLALKLTGTPTAVAGLLVSVLIGPSL
jgi:hypothetical protein